MKITKKIGRLIDATVEPYQEWHLPELEPLLKPSVVELMKAVQADLIRETGILERHCKHGVGHTVGHLRGYLNSNWEGVHGCCGCCEGWPTQETRGE